MSSFALARIKRCIELRMKGLPRIDNSKTLHVIAVYFNHNDFENPKKNFFRFLDHMASLPNVVTHVVELALGGMPFQVSDANNKLHTQLRTKSELFHKENLVNIGVKKLNSLYPDWKYVAWIDADVEFKNATIVEDTIRQLNRHKVVQMWSQAIDLGPDQTPLIFRTGKDKANKEAVVNSFAYCYRELRVESYEYTTATTWHPGYAWAMTRDTWDAIGGLLDVSILGAGDHHMAWAFLKKPMKGIHGKASQSYKDICWKHLKQMADYVDGDLGCVDGMLMHYWHGRKDNRKYVERWDVLVKNGFDPKLDLRMRYDGLLELTNRSAALREGIRAYFRQRNDDCNTLE